jgi:predicted transcriptional regulator
MRRDFVTVPADISVAEFQERVPLGTASKAVVLDEHGRYLGMLATAAGHAGDLAPESAFADVANLQAVTVSPATAIDALLKQFEVSVADELAVVTNEARVLGVVTENYARGRYFEELDRRQREIYGEILTHNRAFTAAFTKSVIHSCDGWLAFGILPASPASLLFIRTATFALLGRVELWTLGADDGV